MADESVKIVPQKRKRESKKHQIEVLTLEERESRVKTLTEELESLFRYFNEVVSSDLGIDSLLVSCTSVNAMIALLLEEKRASYSKLVGEIYEKLREKDDGSVTIASVKSSVLYVGQRMAYGVPNAEADVLEDETDSRLWCWETRDMKFLPSSLRGALKIRRHCRKKINERIIAILDVLSSLQKPEDIPTYKHDLVKATDKLKKVPAEADIRSSVERLTQKNGSAMAEKEAKRKDAALAKELERSEKEKKRLQQEAEKDEKRREKEESEMRKQLKRKQEEIEREQRRKEKEEAELKKQLSVQKQASIMERFLKRSKTSITSHDDHLPSVNISDSNVNKSGSALESVIVLMDSAMQHKDEIDVESIRKSHMNSWRSLGHSVRSSSKHWGIRQKPKTELIKELKLTTNKGPARDDDLCVENLVDGWGHASTDEKSCDGNSNASSLGTSKCLRRKQLLQFDKSHRPAFYGVWPKKSCVVGPRHPLKKDPDLDYDIDSDEEWEEEDPGESLSDSEKEEEENLDEGSMKADDDEESDDGFFVPDGYLSENEGVETERSQSKVGQEITHTPPSCKPETESEERVAWIRQQKYLHNLTEHALRKNQPLIIINMMHEKAQLLSAEELTGTLKVEQMCLQALSMHAFPGGLSIEVPSDNNQQEDNQEASTSNSRGSTAAAGVGVAIADSDLPKMVCVIQSCPQGINRVVESLQQAFPDIAKSHLRNKVREISDFVDNRWKVKKEILEKLGMSSSPEKSGRRTKSIATFFSKRCLPPAGNASNPCESSPESLKPSSSSQQQQQQERTENM